MSHKWPWRGVSWGLTAIALAPVVAGLAGVVGPALMGGVGFAAPVRELAAEPGVWRSAFLSLFTGLLSTAMSVVLTGLILAAAFGGRALNLAERLLAPLLAVPHAAAALGLAVLVAPSGLVLRALSPWATELEWPPNVALVNDPWGLALVAGLVVKEVPFLFLMALAALPRLRPAERVAVARSLGYGRMRAFTHAVWPLLYRQIRLPVLAVLAFAASVVDVALVLGPTQPPTLGVRVLELSQSADIGRWAVGSAAALLMCAVVLAAIGFWLVLERVVAVVAGRARVGGRRAVRDGVQRWGVLTFAGVAVLAMGLGFAGLMLQSVAGFWRFPDFWPATVSGAAWARAFGGGVAPLWHTVALAVGATAIVVPAGIAMMTAGTRGVRPPPVLYLPLLVPQVAFLFGLNVLASGAGLTPGMGTVMLAHAVFVLPYILIALSGPWMALDPRFASLAATLGASPWRRFWAVRLPLMAPTIAVAVALGVAVSAGLYLPTQLIGAGRVPTITTEAVTAAVGGDRRAAGVYAVLQLIVPLVAFALARWLPAVVFRGRAGMVPARLTA
ncbi:MAG: ABC transporter permease subunit [Pseudomonadota bacterium]